MTFALINRTTPPVIVQTFASLPNPLVLPGGNQVHGIASVPWVSQDGAYSLVAVASFVVPAGQVRSGDPSYSFDAGGNVLEIYATVAAPPPPVTSMQLVSTSTPALNGTYSIGKNAQRTVSAVAEYIAVNGRFPDALPCFPLQDSSGVTHQFMTTASFLAFASVMGDFVTAVKIGQIPTQPVTIP